MVVNEIWRGKYSPSICPFSCPSQSPNATRCLEALTAKQMIQSKPLVSLNQEVQTISETTAPDRSNIAVNQGSACPMPCALQTNKKRSEVPFQAENLEPFARASEWQERASPSLVLGVSTRRQRQSQSWAWRERNKTQASRDP